MLRGYGQLFLCNRPLSGALFLAALVLASPVNGLTSLVGAIAAVVPGMMLGRKNAGVRAGLPGINGALLGYCWILAPEIPLPTRIIITAAGGAVIGAALIPLTAVLNRRSSPFSPFSMPYVLAAWAGIGAAALSGQYDSAAGRGWLLYFAGDYPAAGEAFASANAPHPRARAYRSDGAGWALFKQGNYLGALEQFQQAAELLPDFADPWDGIGWSLFKLQRYSQAQDAFHAALDRDPLLADSRNGIGWIHLINGQFNDAAQSFRSSLLICPLLADSYDGWRRSLLAGGHVGAAERVGQVANWARQQIGPRLHFITSFQLAGWLLFLIGVFCHSKLSGLIAAVALHIGAAMAAFLPAGAGAVDINFYYNLAAVMIALGGHYLVLTPAAAVWMAAVAAALAWSWPLVSGIFAAIGLPLLAVPFNVALLTTVVLFHLLFKTRWIVAVPLDVAVTNPRTVRLWQIRRQIADRCWAKIKCF